MKVKDFVEVVSENKKTVLYDCTGEKLTEYDGKNSIDEKFLEEDIIRISIYDGFFVVNLKMQKVEG